MTPTEWAMTGWAGVSCVLYVAHTLSATRGLYAIDTLREVEALELERWPKLSVIIPACNEGTTLRAALTTLLQQDYPELEIVLVDDRSTDETGAIVDELAGTDSRITPVHVKELPSGWLGKVNALARGVERASGEWILFTDADVHYRAAKMLRHAVALGVKRELDHVCLLPQLRAGSFWQECAVDAFGITFFSNLRIHELADPDSPRYVGVGAFNLVRRSTLEQSEGLEWLRMEVADDVGLGYLIRRARGRAGLWLATREMDVLWYPSLRDMARGLEKNLFPIVGYYSVARALARTLFALAILAGLVVALLSASVVMRGLVFLSLASLVLTAWAMFRRIDQRFTPGLFVPIGLFMMGMMVLRSTWKCVRAGGITWRGTFYPMAELRQLQRVKL